jgi:pimeloyl-ACP methyl ester carboxylesterase
VGLVGGLMSPDVRRLALRTSDGLSLVADAWLPPEPATSAVVLVHGLGGHRQNATVLAMAHELWADGHGVITYDMRGHGESGGLCTLGDLERLDVAAAVAAAGGLAPRVVLVGASLGAIAVLRYAAGVSEGADSALAGVVTVSAPARWRLTTARTALAAALTRTPMGRALARRRGVRLDRRWSRPEPPDALAARLTVPLAVVHGRDDRFMPTSEAQVLHDAAPGHRRLDLVTGMGHAYGAQGLEPIRGAVAWCLAVPAAAVSAGQ